MKLRTIVSAVNLKPHYTQFVGQFIKAWTTLFPEVQVVIVLVANEIPEELQPYEKYLHLFPNPEGVSDVLTAQCIRLLWPRFIDSTEGVMITDIDMFPMNRSYYEKPIAALSPNTVAVYRTDGVFTRGNPREIYMCYVCASPQSWRGMFGDKPHAEIIEKWASNTKWETDQIELTKAYSNWNGSKVILKDSQTGFKRLCRSFLDSKPGTPEREIFGDLDALRKYIWYEYFSDYHAITNETHKEVNEYIIGLLASQPKRDKFIPTSSIASYAPLMYSAMACIEGPIVECGMGEFSTRLLHGTGRDVISYETSPEWFGRFPDITSKQLIRPDEWLDIMTKHKDTAGVIFIDQAPGEIREKCLEELSKGYKGIVVCHDTEPAADYGYKMRQHFNWFKYIVEIKCQGAWATALSHTFDVTTWTGQAFGDFVIQPYNGRPTR